ncbi:RIIA lysis inhibitor [Pseudomonas phage PspYZU05]|uniref:RIIA protector from prophage-induced early lysis n=1 Tax=Pseudomonas phage PspYZU05 TaxID=1983556 RepID=A0A2U7NF84_9CAUD|nr:RIIA lysis inhibitor [Pseudomonas phage PspYZU05]ASD52161.1 rIIA protector from prophage-induced early lysis [Pseudomonas phage PspYZU05]
MIPVSNASLIIGGNVNTTEVYGMDVTAKTFKIFSDTIYKNKIRAIARELICNMADAHEQVGNHRPFSIIPPTEFNLTVTFRDFGPGLSPEQVIKVFAVYFRSTKTESINQIGELGLGAKTPYCYNTRSFVMHSYQNGIKRSYACMMGENGPVPPQLISEEETTERDGLEIIIPVAQEDIQTWENEIVYCLRPFKKYAPFNYEHVNFFTEDQIQDRSDVHGQSIYALYCNIVYPLKDVPGLSWGILKEKYPSPVIRFEPGLLDFMPSREELSLDKTTIKNVIERVNTVQKEILDETAAKLAAISNLRERTRAFSKLGHNTRSAIKSDYDIKIMDSVELTESQRLSIMNGSYLHFYPASRRKTWSYNARKRLVSLAPIKDRINIHTTSLNVLVVDVESKRTKAIRQIEALNRGMTDLIVVTCNSALNALSEYMDGDELNIFYASKVMEGVTKVPRTKTESRPASPNVYSYVDGYIKHLNLTASEVANLKGYAMYQYFDDFIDIDSVDSQSKISIMNPSRSRILDLAEAAGIKKEHVYFIRMSARKAVERSELKSLFPELLKEYEKRAKFGVSHHFAYNISSFGYRIQMIRSPDSILLNYLIGLTGVKCEFNNVELFTSVCNSDQWKALDAMVYKRTDTLKDRIRNLLNIMQPNRVISSFICSYSECDQSADFIIGQYEELLK